MWWISSDGRCGEDAGKTKKEHKRINTATHKYKKNTIAFIAFYQCVCVRVRRYSRYGAHLTIDSQFFFSSFTCYAFRIVYLQVTYATENAHQWFIYRDEYVCALNIQCTNILVNVNDIGKMVYSHSNGCYKRTIFTTKSLALRK